MTMMTPSSTQRFFLVSVMVSLMLISINGQCTSNTECLNGGSCFGNVCSCDSNWTGNNCESPVGPCAGNECVNGATCQPYRMDYICDCRPAHKGIYCEFLANYTSCNSTPCVHGECADEGNGNVFCDCTPFTDGAFCERTPSCTNRDPCRHNGQCMNGATNQPSSCNCNSDWTGDICEFPLTCNLNTCRNGGTCTSFEDFANCDCTDQWEGPTCEDPITTCTTVGCANGGTCANGICVCPQVYTGEFCEEDANNTCASDYCFNGGTCTDVGTTAYCICPQNFTGEYCETAKSCFECESLYSCVSDPYWVCDGEVDCFYGEDELNCTTSTPATSSCFKCESNFPCVYDPQWVCDGDNDCYSGEDELNCTPTSSCFECESNFPCVYDPNWVCDGDDDCYSGEDELNCKPTCFECISHAQCVRDPDWVCNGNIDCIKGEDELDCEKPITNCTTSGCANGGTCANGICDCTELYTGKFCEEDRPTNNGLSGGTIGIIAGSAAGVVILIVIIIAIACYCCRKKRDDDKDELTGLEMGANQRRGRPHDYVPSPTKTLVPAIPNLRVSTMRDETKIEFPRNRLTLISKIGSGSFADVYKAEALGIIMKEEKTIVAVKRLKETATENDKRDLSKELSLFMYLDPHPNIVNMLGCCTDVDPWYIVMEYLPNGNLQGYLRKIRTGESMTSDNKNVEKQKDIPPNDLLNFGVQIARGMEYLASRACIHRDLAARNILLGEGWVCKVSDFGLARDLEDGQTYEMKSQGRVPVRWMSPESLLHNTYTSQSDVWSFAILIWEIVTLGAHPYPGMSSKQVVKEISAGYKLPKPEHCSQDIYDLMKECWAYEGEERPTFSQVKIRLESMLADAQGYLVMSNFNDDDYLYLEPDAHTGDTFDNEGFSHLE